MNHDTRTTDAPAPTNNIPHSPYQDMLEWQAEIEGILQIYQRQLDSFAHEPVLIPHNTAGIYFLWGDLIWSKNQVGGFRLMYIGQSCDVRHRLSYEHKAYDQGATELIGFVGVRNQKLRECIEAALIGLCNPPLNVVGRTDLK